jgi:beta-galactosidase
MYRILLAAFTAGLVATAAPAQADAGAPRERLSFNAGWRFIKGDPAATPAPAAAAGFDDAGWRKLDLPHDWGIEGPFQQEYPGETGKLPWWGVAWYRKHFDLPAGDAGRRIFLDIDGAMSHATVYINGHDVGGWPYGYASWRVDLTPYVKPGGANVVAIRLDNPPESSRWYPGGGIYRNVWLVKTAPVHVAYNGTFVTTPQIDANRAAVDLQVTVANDGTSDADLRVATAIYALDAAGRRTGAPVARTAAPVAARVGGGAQAQVAQALAVAKPRLWSPDSPQRYVAVTTITAGSRTVDVVETPFGIRSIAFDAKTGFMLNGRRMAIQGVCMHHDLGALGAAINVRALQRQLEILREMGVNAIRTSHNPPAPELLDLADRMGFLVMDEAFDAWQASKKKNDYSTLFAAWHEKDLRALVRRDRNHPSVVLWSIGNEIPEETKAAGVEMAKHLAGIVHDEDRTRPVTAASNHIPAGYNGFQNAVDVFGYNYKPGEYAKFREKNPSVPLFGSETSSTVSSRGEYFFPVANGKEGMADFQVSSYDVVFPRWAALPDTEFAGLDDNPSAFGEFVWTGFDYLGEPTPYNTDATNVLNFSDPTQRARMAQEMDELKKIRVPSRSSYFGIVDLAGFKKDRFYLYQARWRPDLPMAHLLPHWNWPDRVGQVTPVHLYTSGDEAELFLNGQSLGRKKRGPRDYRLRWDDVVYQPGELRAVVYKNGKPWAADTVRTTGAAAQLQLAADRSKLLADGSDLAFVTVKVADKDGLTVPRAHDRIRFTLSGPGEIVATDNGDATSFESFQSPERAAYNGLALAIVKTRPGQGGKLVLTAEADGLQGAQVVLESGKP